MTVKEELLAELVDKTLVIGRSIGAEDNEIAIAFAKGMAAVFAPPRDREPLSGPARVRAVGVHTLDDQQIRLPI